MGFAQTQLRPRAPYVDIKHFLLNVARGSLCGWHRLAAIGGRIRSQGNGKLGHERIPFVKGGKALQQDLLVALMMAHQALGPGNKRPLTVVRHGGHSGKAGILDHCFDAMLVGTRQDGKQIVAQLILAWCQTSLEEHPVQSGQQGDTSATHMVSSIITRFQDPIQVLFGVWTMPVEEDGGELQGGAS